MKSMIHPGAHPDAEMLTAFAEQLVNERERAEILTHLSGCSRCREVVFLARVAIEAEEPASQAVKVSKINTARGWFAGWRLAWVPMTALAGIVGFAVIRHAHRASLPEPHMAQNAPPPEPLRGANETKAASTSQAPPQEPQARGIPRKNGTAVERPGPDAEQDRKYLDERDAAAEQKKDEAPNQSNSRGVTAPKTSDEIHGTFAARAKSSSLGGPLLQNQVQQNNTQLQQNYSSEARQAGVPSDSVNKPATSQTQTAGASQTISVEAAPAPVPVSPAPSAAPVMAAAQVQAQSIVLSGKEPSKLKAAIAKLPGGRAVRSEAAAGSGMVAVDETGSVFLSDDAGRHWQVVNAPWEGRAVGVKLQQGASARGSLLEEQDPPRFELTTDKPETWVSADGKQWTREYPAPNR